MSYRDRDASFVTTAWGRMLGAGAGRGLTFPNPSRSYDEERHAVRFWGYDKTFEISFVVEGEALSRLDARASTGEAGFLDAFDAHIERIHAVAGRVYARRRTAAYVYSYTLTDSDFRDKA